MNTVYMPVYMLYVVDQAEDEPELSSQYQVAFPSKIHRLSRSKRVVESSKASRSCREQQGGCHKKWASVLVYWVRKAGRCFGTSQVVEEQKRESDPGYSKKVAAKRRPWPRGCFRHYEVFGHFLAVGQRRAAEEEKKEKEEAHLQHTEDGFFDPSRQLGKSWPRILPASCRMTRKEAKAGLRHGYCTKGSGTI